VRSDSDPCPSLAVEKEKWENEKSLALSAEREKHSADVIALQSKEQGLRNELVKSESNLKECNSNSVTWRESAENAETLMKGLREKEDVLNLRLKRQNFEFTEERITFENQIARSAAEAESLREQLEKNKSTVSELLSERETTITRLAELKEAVESKSRELESAATKCQETERLEKKVSLLKEEIQNMTMVEGDILIGGSWLQVPTGWHGRVSLDLRILRNIWDLVWVRTLQLVKVVEVPKQYHELFLSGASVMKKVPSLEDVRFQSIYIMFSVQEFMSNLFKEFSPRVKTASENVYTTLGSSLGAGKQLYDKKVQPYVWIVSDRVSKIYHENEVGQLYVDPLYEIAANSVLPFYTETVLPLYKEKFLPTVGDLPKYRSQVESYAMQLKEHIQVNWLLIKKFSWVAMGNVQVQYRTWSKSVKAVYSTVSDKGGKVFKELSEPLEMFGGKLRFEGGTLEAALVGVAFTLVLWHASSFVGLTLQFAYVSFIFVFRVCWFLLVTLAFRVILCKIVWNCVIVIPARTICYTLSFLFRAVVIVLKVVLFPFRMALRILKCTLKLMCCCGFFTCCRKSKTKKESKITNGKVPTKINGKARKASPKGKTSSDSSDGESKNKKKKGSKKSKRSNQKVNGSKTSEKKRKKRGKR